RGGQIVQIDRTSAEHPPRHGYPARPNRPASGGCRSGSSGNAGPYRATSHPAYSTHGVLGPVVLPRPCGVASLPEFFKRFGGRASEFVPRPDLLQQERLRFLQRRLRILIPFQRGEALPQPYKDDSAECVVFGDVCSQSPEDRFTPVPGVIILAKA